MKCPKCQTENREGVKFCEECGAKLELVCPNCGATVLPDKKFCYECGHPLTEPTPEPQPARPPSLEPTSFADGRYQVKKLLGEGGKKRVYLAHDTRLGRDIAFALIKTEGLDAEARVRIEREAQAMGRLGDHPSIMTIHDTGEHEGQPYLVLPLMPGGDIEGLIEKAPEGRLSFEQAINITTTVCLGLEFAHAKGIIHRDLKPGNVWLSADGTARIGDFGLALATATDLSRLTQEGMMVGTAFYMPPEQAMGREVTPRSDLYSLGAMLYEMVTGRPPFVGDTSVAIITQHIDSSPPVSPTWHRKDIPPGLEALIMQLLEKDPEKRPASAADVLKALDTIDLGEVGRAPTEEAPTVDRDPLYRRTFVGRDTELKLLQSAFDGAASGQGALMMVVGEPGIGKTAICEQLSTYATVRGGKYLVGHCYEEGSLSLPYLAFVEAMRSYVLDRSTRDLRKELGTGAADIARIVSEVREKLNVKPKEEGDPQEERYRLMQAVTGFLTNAARVQPLLIILEDLHDADKGTLEMLTHVSRNLGGARLLIVGTYRDVEVDRTHALSASLAELRRVASFDRVLLRGLDIDEVQRMMNAISGQEVTWGLAETVHRQTEGNPLFVQEVLRYLRESGLVTREDGRWQPGDQTALEMSIPEGLRDVIGKRLSLLSEECNRMLSIAAVIGREFRLEALQQVASVSEDDLYAALEETKSAVIVEERTAVGAAVTYRFTHAFFKQTLYEEIIAPRRIRLHQQVGQVLEEVYGRRLEEHAAELAEHFSYYSDPDCLAKAVSYSEMAAERATSVYAYGEAVRLLEQALKVQEVLDPEDKEKRCDLLLTTAEALVYSGEPRRALDVELPAGFSLAEAIGDSRRASRACRVAFVAVLLEGIMESMATPEAAQWAERADRHAMPDTAERAWADTQMGFIKNVTGEWTEGVRLLTRALKLTHRLDDLDVFAWAAVVWLSFAAAPQHAEDRLCLAEEVVERTRGWRGGRLPSMMRGPAPLIDTFLASGQRIRAEEVISEHREMTERTGQVHDEIASMILDVPLATLDGRLEEAEDMALRTRARGEERGVAEWTLALLGMVSLRPRLHLRKADDAIQPWIQAAAASPVGALCLAHLGRDAEVVEILEQLVLARPGIGSTEDEAPA
jgi:hypothetical protein